MATPTASSSSTPPGQRALAALRLAAPASRVLFHRLWERFRGAEGLLDASFSRLLAASARLGESGARAIARALENPALDRELALARRLGARWIALGDEEYPANLAESPCPPPILTAMGAPLGPWARRSVALVGSRRATPYGLEAAKRIGGGLGRADIAVVSGLAVGVDTAAMLAATRAGGRTIGVLGSGLAEIYPASAAQHLDELLERGALLSEYPLATRPERERFPERNWIIAAMTLGTCVVEAAERSGTFITANCALDCNRSVFAVPADIARSASQGANKLIREGAQLVARAEDIIADLAPRLRQLLDEELGEEGGGLDGAEAETAAPPTRAKPNAPPPAGEPAPTAVRSAAPREERARVERGVFVPPGEATPVRPPKPPPDPFRERPGNETASRRKSSPEREPAAAPPPPREAPDSPPAKAAAAPLPASLTPLQRALAELLGDAPIHRDELVRAGAAQGATDGELAMALLDLEMEGIARQLPGKLYARG